jgi:hypothetical protein
MLIHWWYEYKLYNQYGKQYGVSFKKLEIDLSYDPVIPPLGIYSKECESV